MKDGQEPTLGNDIFARHLASLLRAPVQLDPSFELRVLTQIQSNEGEFVTSSRTVDAQRAHTSQTSQRSHQTDTETRRGWWTRPRSISVTPAGIAGITVGLAAILLLSIITVPTLLQPTSAPTPETLHATAPPTAVPNGSIAHTTDTVYLIRFVLTTNAAQSVSVVGDFNGWAKQATQLTQTSRPGVWVTEVHLPPGRYEYAFIVDGQRWVPDPLADRRADEFGTESSVVTVGPWQPEQTAGTI